MSSKGYLSTTVIKEIMHVFRLSMTTTAHILPHRVPHLIHLTDTPLGPFSEENVEDQPRC